ncbi:hypothetical protein SO574_01140 [Vibrio alfacsensis]|uniref:hypothetical protein n=1 Tax=Vibrio alfacsensis TaxID=1074311 RepID=UPI002ADD74C7|nr:hypothetical protein [Vibrio alfacsensis]WQE76438.1 hypothetical protein SO574_01140 [Vibrio alfacsensis]
MNKLSSIEKKVIIESLENHFYYDLYVSKSLGFKRPIFRPYQKVGMRGGAVVLDLLKAVIFILISPFFCIINKKLIRLSCFPSDLESSLYFITGSKAEAIFSVEKHDKSSIIKWGYKQRDGVVFGISDIFDFYGLLFMFFSKYWKFPWFYSAILWLPELNAFFKLVKSQRPKKIHMCNHYDRWAYILSFYSKYYGVDLELHQHGIVNKDYKPHKKLPIISKLYAYNTEQVNIFCENICKTVLTYECIKPKINLSPISIDKKSSLLIVGHGDANIMKSLCNMANDLESLNLHIFIKPHPAFDFMKTNDVFILDDIDMIDDKHFFPDVDYLCHCGSTLAVEYESSSSKVKCFNLEDYKTIEEFKECLFQFMTI